MRSKKPSRKPSTSAFEAFLATKPRSSKSCATCASGAPIATMIARYVERARSTSGVPKVSQLWEFLRDEHGYAWTYAALQRHIRECLGYRARG